ncbi:MAG: hypothetical protein KDB00_15725 [Planctomycetales bacterium]|nr:hypothetical protein [Planctomycetales bacterium]
MSETQDCGGNDRLLELIRESFDEQLIPDRPTDFVRDYMEGDRQSRFRFVTLQRHTFLVTSLSGSVPVIAICILFAVLIYPSADGPKRQSDTLGRKESFETVSDLATADGNDSDATVVDDESAHNESSGDTVHVQVEVETLPPTVVVQTPTDVDQPPAQNAAVVGKPDSELLKLIKLLNRLTVTPQAKVAHDDRLLIELAEQFSRYFDSDLDAHLAGVQSMNKPVGLTYLRDGVPSERSWILGKDDNAFSCSYQIQIDLLLSDLIRLVNATIGEDIFEPMLDGIRDDPDGPRVDLRGELFSEFEDHAYVVVGRGGEDSDDRMMIAIPVRNKTKVAGVVSRLFKVDPDATLDNRGGAIVAFTHSQGRQRAACIVGQCLVVGDRQMVLDALERYSQ